MTSNIANIDNSNIPDKRSLIVKLAEKKNEVALDNAFAPAVSLGAPKKGSKYFKDYMAMDTCIRNVLSQINASNQFVGFPAFVGYALLSSVSQEALIRAGVEAVADDMTRKPVELFYDEDGNEDGEKLINDLNADLLKFKVKEVMNKAKLKDGFFGGCLVYIDVGNLSDEQKMKPLLLDKRTFKVGSLRGFKIIEPVNICAGDYNTTDPMDEHFFNPEWWYILGKRYHSSRFLYIAGNDVDMLLKPAYNFFGISEAQLALDYVAHFVANREAAQELLNKFSLTCIGTNLSQALTQDGSWSDIVARIKAFNKFKTNNGTFVFDKETEELMQLNTPLSGVKDIVEMSLTLLTAIWRIPKLVYIGEGEGGLNASSQEQLRTYYSYIHSLQEKIFTKPYDTIIKILQLNRGLEPDEKLMFKFPSLWDMDEKERADLNKVLADRDIAYINSGVLSQEECRKRLAMDRNSGYNDIDVDDLPEPQQQPLEQGDKEDDKQDITKDEWNESDHPRDEVGKFIDKNGSSNGGLLDGVDFYDIESAKDYINIPNRFKKEAEGWDNQKAVKKIARILENPVMSEMWNRVELAKEKEKKKEIIDHISRNEYIATPETLMFYLYDGFDGQTTVKDFMKKYDVYDETYIKQMLSGLSVNYPEFISFSDTLGLDVINLNKSKSEKEDYYTIKIVDENGDLYDEKTVLASKNLIKKIYGDKVSSIQKETKKMRIDGAELLFESESQQAQDIAMDGRWITIGAREKGENGEDDEGRKGRHIYLEDGETPEEAVEELKKDDKKDKKPEEKKDESEQKEPDKKSDASKMTDEEIAQRHAEYSKKATELLRKGREAEKDSEEYKDIQKQLKELQDEYDDVLTEREKRANKNNVFVNTSGQEKETQKEENSESKQEKVKQIIENANFGKIKKETVDKIKGALSENFKEFEDVSDVIAGVGSIQAMSKEDQKNALLENKEQIESTIKATEERYFKTLGEEGISRQFGSVDAFRKRVRDVVEKRIKKTAQTRAGGETAHYSWNLGSKKGNLRFNEKVINDSMFSFKQELCEKTGYHPPKCVGIKSTTDHEFGHAIERYILEKNENAPSYKELGKLYNDLLVKRQIAEKLSKYAGTNFSEFIAEGYSEYKNNKPPREVAQKIGELLTKAYMEAKNG